MKSQINTFWCKYNTTFVIYEIWQTEKHFLFIFLRSGRHNTLQFTNLFHKNNDIMQFASWRIWRYHFFSLYLCTRCWVIVRLVVHRQVFYDAVYSRMWNWVRLPIRNPVFPQSPRLPLYKEKLRILTKLRKNERNAKGKLVFLFKFSNCSLSFV